MRGHVSCGALDGRLFLTSIGQRTVEVLLTVTVFQVRKPRHKEAQGPAGCGGAGRGAPDPPLDLAVSPALFLERGVWSANYSPQAKSAPLPQAFC